MEIDWLEVGLPELSELDVPSLIRGRYVTSVGHFASMTREEFIELLEANGGKHTPRVARGVAAVVVGQRDWPLAADGALPEPLRQVRNLIRNERSRIRVISEEQFLSALGLESYRQNVQRLYTLSTVTQVLGVSRERVRAWVAAGLIRPSKIEYGVWYFDLRQVSAAKTLSDLIRSGVPLRRLRLSLEQLRRWLPEAQEPLTQLTALEGNRGLLVRLEDGELLEPDGQLRLEFDSTAESGSLKIMPGPRTAAEWSVQAEEQEEQGQLAEATESYRKALLLGGPDARLSFNLANVLAAQGKKPAAVERYLQAVEIEPKFVEAWNNLGLVLADLGRPDDACSAFGRAIAIDPNDPRAHYNLADLLDSSGRRQEALPHWRSFLRFDATSERAAFARRQVATS